MAPAVPVVVRYRRPKDRRSKPQRWADSVATLLDVLEGYQDWRDNLPAGLVESEMIATRDRHGIPRARRLVRDHARFFEYSRKYNGLRTGRRL